MKLVLYYIYIYIYIIHVKFELLKRFAKKKHRVHTIVKHPNKSTL
jgi:hypothetical protein